MAAKKPFSIETHRGKAHVEKGDVSATLEWNPEFKQRFESALGGGGTVQQWVDATVLEGMTPYMPFDTGMLVASGKLNTEIGSGLLVWRTPYARYLYYGMLMVDPETGSAWAKKDVRKVKAAPETPLVFWRDKQPRSGSFWCERWKRDNLVSFEADLQRKVDELLHR